VCFEECLIESLLARKLEEFEGLETSDDELCLEEFDAMASKT
jgi:hypothetical protein